MTQTTLSPFEPVKQSGVFSLFPLCTSPRYSDCSFSSATLSLLFFSPSLHVHPPSFLFRCTYLPSIYSILPILCSNSLLSTFSLSLPDLSPIFHKFSTPICLAVFSSSVTSLPTVIAPHLISFTSMLLSIFFPLTALITRTDFTQLSSDKTRQQLTSQFIIHCPLTTFPACQHLLSLLSNAFYLSTRQSDPIFSVP